MSQVQAKARLIALSLFCTSSLLAGGVPIAPPGNWGPNPAPWFTGPLLTPSGHVITGGHLDLEPYLFLNANTGAYDDHGHSSSEPLYFSINLQESIQIGINSWMDFQITPQMYWNHSKGQSALVMGDLSAGFDFQLLSDSYDNYYPAIKFYIREVFPTGNYQRLDPEKLGVDSSGSGSYATSIGFVFSRLFHLHGIHFLSVRFNPGYIYFAPTFVNDFNAYGGGAGTRGWVYPGSVYKAFLGLEYNFTKHWAFALDVAAVWTGKTRFSGDKGFIPGGTIPATIGLDFGREIFVEEASIGGPASAQYSLAPAIEYLFNPSVGAIAGVWFTVGGRNTYQFVNGVIALNYYY